MWALFYQLIGGAIIIPIYYLAYMRESAQPDYWSPASRRIPTSYAKALLPSLVIGYLLPTILMYLPFQDINITQGLVALWQPSPLIVNLLLFFSASFGQESVTSKEPVSGPPNHMKYVNRLYFTCFAVTTIAHVGTILLCLSSSDSQMSLTQTLGRVPVGDRTSMSGALHYVFQADFWILFTAALTGAFLTLWDLRRIGQIDLSMSKTVVAMAVGVVCVGPAATILGVWYVREHITAQKDKK